MDRNDDIRRWFDDSEIEQLDEARNHESGRNDPDGLDDRSNEARGLVEELSGGRRDETTFGEEAREASEDQREGKENETARKAVERRMAAAVVIVAEEAARSAGLAIHDDVMQAIVHLTLTYAEQLARGVQHFARHAKRKRVEPEDLIISAHRNQALMKKLQALAASIGEEGKKARCAKITKMPAE